MTAPSPRIGIIVTDAYPIEDPDHDTPLLLESLRARGATAEPVVWHSDAADLTDFDLLVLRSPWDYPQRPDEFLMWLDRAEQATRVANEPATMRWNLDKFYLADLEHAGVAVVPTRYCRSRADAEAAIRAHRRVVVKPTVSAGAKNTGLFDATDPRALALAELIIDGGGVAMVQPEIPELSAGAEKALYAIDGHFTHAIAKGALLDLGGTLIGGVYMENPRRVDATASERLFVEDVLRAVAEVTGDEMPLYARVDTVDSAEYGLVLLEVELVEPALNLHVATDAIDVVADAILRAAGREALSAG
ncbi:RimK family alpha-L-glutamate ligase [Microbacterium koreense]|uniref:RimK family alpha-L-glutamate ligase n=1 Tax=Microbacterium koreense TaxID=323761 RepID=A0ABW2ZQ72_9MICO